MKPLSLRLLIIIIVILCIVSRLPQLLSPNLMLDGDECVLALMSKHIASFKGFPLFFYGQAYGFSLTECLAIILLYSVFGMTTISVKLAMLLLWTIGVVFMFKTFLKINNGNYLAPFLLAIIFICAPAWAMWSMNARGGYLTAFMLTAVLLNLLFDQQIKYTFFMSFVTVILFVLVFEGQPLWIPGLVPFSFYKLHKEGSIKKGLAFIILSVVLLALFHIHKQGLPHANDPHPFYPSGELFLYIRRIPHFLFCSLHGHYFSYQVQRPDTYSALFAYMFCALSFFLCIIAICNLLRRKKGTMLFNLSALSVLLTLSYTVFSKDVQPRYLLPVMGYVLLSSMLFLQTIVVNKKLLTAMCSLFIICGSISLFLFKDFRFSTIQKDKFFQLLTYLSAQQVHYVYCYDYMLTYQVIFYSDESILARQRELPGRYQPYTEQVDNALQNGAKTAFIGNQWQIRGMNFTSITNFYGYMIVIDPPKNELIKAFEF